MIVPTIANVSPRRGGALRFSLRGRLLWILLGLVLAGALLPAQESSEGGQETPAADPGPGLPRVYIIRSVDFEVAPGSRSRPFALMNKGEFKTGERIAGEEGMERYIARKEQILMNQRVLESVEISYTLGAGETEGGEELIPADLLVRVRDTWNIIALPYPKFDSNSGFEFIIKARDYNFLGTLNPLRVDLGFKRNNEGKNSYLFDIDLDVPFRAWGYTWNFNFDHNFSYTFGSPLYYKNTTGLSLDVPFKTTTFTFGIDEYVIVNEENSDTNKPLYGERFDGGYMASELYTSWKIPTGIKMGYFGDLNYTPKVTGRINYRPGGAVDDPRSGPALKFSHSLGFDRIDWVGNYRQGLDIKAENSFEYTFYNESYYRENWNRNVSLTGIGHYPFSKYIGVSGRAQMRAWFDDPLEDAGDNLRGLWDKSVMAKTMLSANLEVPVRLVHFYPSELFHNRKLRWMDFEVHASPFIDLALVQGWAGDPDSSTGREETSFSPKNLLCTGGMEVIIFPAFMRSLYLRASLGYNLREVARTKSLPRGINREIFIGLGHYY